MAMVPLMLLAQAIASATVMVPVTVTARPDQSPLVATCVTVSGNSITVEFN